MFNSVIMLFICKLNMLCILKCAFISYIHMSEKTNYNIYFWLHCTKCLVGAMDSMQALDALDFPLGPGSSRVLAKAFLTSTRVRLRVSKHSLAVVQLVWMAVEIKSSPKTL